MRDRVHASLYLGRLRTLTSQQDSYFSAMCCVPNVTFDQITRRYVHYGLFECTVTVGGGGGMSS